MKKNTEYPKIVFVQNQKEQNNDEEYLLVWDKAENANDGVIAVYELKEIKIKETKTILK